MILGVLSVLKTFDVESTIDNLGRRRTIPCLLPKSKMPYLDKYDRTFDPRYYVMAYTAEIKGEDLAK